MKYTNNHSLPDYLQRWLEYDDYDYVPGTISATGLLSPVRQTILKQRHFNEIEIDLADLISRRFGTAIHGSFELVPMPHIDKEQRVVALVGGKKITGKYDMLKHIDSGVHRIIDIKSTSVWNAIYRSSLEHWKLQVSIYRFILEQDGWAIKDGKMVERKAIKVSRHSEICLVFTDWKRSDMKKHHDYPPIRVSKLDIELYGTDFTKDFIVEKLKTIDETSKLSDNDLPFCTDEELWIKNTWAVMKKGRKSAVRVFKTEEEAESLLKSFSDEHYMEVRKGMAGACSYCDARSVCNQYEELKKQGLIEGEGEEDDGQE